MVCFRVGGAEWTHCESTAGECLQTSQSQECRDTNVIAHDAQRMLSFFVVRPLALPSIRILRSVCEHTDLACESCKPLAKARLGDHVLRIVALVPDELTVVFSTIDMPATL